MKSNIDAEISVLSSILAENELLDDAEDIKASDFHHPQHKAIFSAMLNIHQASKPIDTVTLKEYLKDSVDITTIMKLSQDFTPVSSFNHHKKILIDNATRRTIVNIGRGLAGKVDEYDDMDELLDKAEDAVLSARRDSQSGIVKIGDRLTDIYTDIEKRQKEPGKIWGVKSGFDDIDKATGGFEKEKLYYIAARPGMGKSSWLTQVCMTAVTNNIPTIMFSMEMGIDQTVTKILSQINMIPNNDFKFGTINDTKMESIAETMKNLYNLPFVIDGTSGITLGQMKTKIKKFSKAFGGVGLVCIDYLTYMGGSDENKRITIENNSVGLKNIAREFKVPVVCLCQLSRAPELRDNKRPLLSDLRETGAIEQDADMAAFLYRDDYYNPDTEDQGIAEFIIRKNREGNTGIIKLGWLGECTLFLDYDMLERRRGEG